MVLDFFGLDSTQRFVKHHNNIGLLEPSIFLETTLQSRGVYLKQHTYPKGLFDILLCFSRLAEAFEIDYMIIDGTLLGQIRPVNDIIAWDTDVDVCFVCE